MADRKSKKKFAKKEKKVVNVETTWVKRVTYEGKPYYWDTAKDDSIPAELRIRWDKPEILKSAEEKAKTSGEWIWIPHPEKIWQPAKKIKTGSDGAVVAQPYKGKQHTIPKDGVVPPGPLTKDRTQKVEFWKVNHTGLAYLEDDVIALDPVDEATMLHNLEARYMQDKLYTWVGAGRSILLSMNPYVLIEGLYDKDTMQFHKTKGTLKPDKWVPPHVFAIGNQAYDSMLAKGSNQSILVNGESGSGKTEATKQILDFYAKQIGSDAEEHYIADKLVVSNPLLEAFGNAKTIRNNNSSRFGKWIKVSFDSGSQKISGAQFVNFMLEKTRVIHQQKNERNYHIFYQLTGDKEACTTLGLLDAKKYRYLNQSGVIKVKGIDDAADFAIVKRAFKALEFTDEEVAAFFQLVAGVLKLGNLTFENVDLAGGNTGSKIRDLSWAQSAAKLFEVEDDYFTKATTNRSIVTRGEKIYKPLDAQESADAVDALAKAIYGNLFAFLALRMNESMQPPSEGSFIGILDIFGFENLEFNSFEQLCINFCNEKLQQYLDNHVFHSEEDFYRSEGVDFEFLKFIDNQPTLDLLEGSKPLGMLRTLDDEGRINQGSDLKWLNKVEKEFSSHPSIAFDKKRRFQSELSFEVNHYAGTVKYDASNFVVKNKDTMWNELYELMATSKNAVIQRVFPAVTMTQSNIKPVAAQFRGHLNVLLQLIDSTEARYIRCIKPNNVMQPKIFEAPLIHSQLKNSGVYDTVRIREGGYPFRISHKQFAYRFSCINRGHKYEPLDDDETLRWRNRCAEILNAHARDFNPEDIKIGNTMVLYRVTEYKPLRLERNLAIEIFLPGVQGFIRGAIGRDYAKQIHEAHNVFRKAQEVGNDIVMVRKGFQLAEDTMAYLKERCPFLPAYPMFHYEEGKYLEGRLMAWEEHERYMNTLVEGQTAEIVTVERYKELIAACAKADADKESGGLGDVVRTAAQVELYDLSQRLIKESNPGLVDAHAGPSFEHFKANSTVLKYRQDRYTPADRAEMKKWKDLADRIGYDTEAVRKITAELERLQVKDAETVQALVRHGIAGTYVGRLKESQKTLADALEVKNDIVLLRKGFEQADAIREWLGSNPYLPAYPMHLYDKGRTLEGRLVAWEELQAEIEGYIDGKSASDVDVELYKKLIDACKRADGELGDVTRTAAQVELYDKTQQMIKDSDPGWVDAKAGPAIEGLIREEMQKVKDKADEIGYETEETEKLGFILGRLVYIDKEAVEAYDVLDGVRMDKVLEESKTYKHTNDALKLIQEFFDKPEKECVLMELKKAQELGDKPREIHRKIRLQEIHYDESGNKYLPHTSFKGMRDPKDYAAGKLCGKAGLIDGMHKWTKGGLPNALTMLPKEDPNVPPKELPDEVKQMKKDVKKRFKNVQIAMGDKKNKNPDKFIQDFLQYGTQNEGARDELYCQVLKQITDNPEVESVQKGYDLLAMMLTTFLPSTEFTHYVVMWIRTHPDPNNEVRKYTSALHKLQFSEEGATNQVNLGKIRKDITALQQEGSRYSIRPGAYTGPTSGRPLSQDLQEFNKKVLANAL